MESSLTSGIQSLLPIQGVANNVGLFGYITEKLREVCISMSTDHFRNKANEYPETNKNILERTASFILVHSHVFFK